MSFFKKLACTRKQIPNKGIQWPWKASNKVLVTRYWLFSPDTDADISSQGTCKYRFPIWYRSFIFNQNIKSVPFSLGSFHMREGIAVVVKAELAALVNEQFPASCITNFFFSPNGRMRERMSTSSDTSHCGWSVVKVDRIQTLSASTFFMLCPTAVTFPWLHAKLGLSKSLLSYPHCTSIPWVSPNLMTAGFSSCPYPWPFFIVKALSLPSDHYVYSVLSCKVS